MNTPALAGERVTLEPLSTGHAEGLLAAAEGDPHLWDFLPYGPFDSVGELGGWIGEREASEDPDFLTVVDARTGRPAGVVSFLRHEPTHRVVEIGHVWFGASLQRTPGATEAIFLLARHAFGEMDVRRLEWKCNAVNDRSRRAAERFGFTYEGTFRQHMIVKGGNRDTAWFSLLDGEWPAARAAFEGWLDPANFDADGRQRASLESLRAA